MRTVVLMRKPLPPQLLRPRAVENEGLQEGKVGAQNPHVGPTADSGGPYQKASARLLHTPVRPHPPVEPHPGPQEVSYW